MSSTGIARASDKVTFSPIAHKAALIRVLDSHAAKGSKVNELRISPSALNSTWVYYKAGLHNSGGEDFAEGFAHWVTGTWLIVYRPRSEGCGPLHIPDQDSLNRPQQF